MNIVNFIEDFIVKPESTYSTDNVQGTGAYASVFDSDMPNMVVKRGALTDDGLFYDGWLLWAIYCMNIGEKRGIPYSVMPRIHGLVINYETRIFHAVMEKLMDKRDDSKDIRKKCINGSYNSVKHEIGYKIFNFFTDIGKPFIKKYNKVPLFVDAHDDNWMWRKTSKNFKMVLTDPFVIEYEFRRNKEKIFLVK